MHPLANLRFWSHINSEKQEFSLTCQVLYQFVETPWISSVCKCDERFCRLWILRLFLGMKTHYRFLVRWVPTDITLDDDCPTEEISSVGNKNVAKKKWKWIVVVFFFSPFSRKRWFVYCCKVLNHNWFVFSIIVDRILCWNHWNWEKASESMTMTHANLDFNKNHLQPLKISNEKKPQVEPKRKKKNL